MKKITLFLIIILTTVSFAQDGTLDYSFNPSSGATNGGINASGLQSDGKIIVGGDFTHLNNEEYNKLGRLNTDGILDNTFNIGSGFNNNVNAICIQSDGKILVGGNFTIYNGVTINRIVRLNIDGTIDSTFNCGSGANGNINAIKLQTDGKIIIVGEFTIFNGFSKNRIVRLNLDGSLDTTFNITTGANNRIFSCILQSDGKIIIGGSFTTFNSINCKRIARLNSDGTIDNLFNTNNAANSTVKSISLQSDNKIIIGGEFTDYNGVAANYIIRLNSDSTIDTTFNIGTGFSYFVNSIACQTDGKIVVGGSFFSYNNSDCNRFVRLNIDGTIDSSFTSIPNSGADATVNIISILSDGKIFLLGNFANCNGYSRNKIARLISNGSLDNSFYPFYENGLSTDGGIRSITIQTDSKIIVCGDYNTYNGLSKKNIVRLNNNGTIDNTFNVGLGTNGIIKKSVVLPNNKIIIVGDFTQYNGVTRNRIARLNADGTLDLTFNINGIGANGAVHTITTQTDGKIIIGGDFSSYNGTLTGRLTRLNIDGTIDTTFNPGIGPDGNLWTISIQTDGKIIIGGLFAAYNGYTTGCLARLNTNGSFDSTFNVGGSGTSYFVYTSSIQNDGKILVGGTFTSFNSSPHHGLVRLNSNGSVDSTFNFNLTSGFTNNVILQNDGKIIATGYINGIIRLNVDGTLDNTLITGTGFDNGTNALALQNDGKILVGGSFTYYNGVLKKHLIRLNSTNTLDVNNFENTNTNSIYVYPNPTKDFLKIKLPNNINVSRYEVFDLLGKKIDSNKLNNSDFINVNNYNDGIYFLNLITDNGILISKFIKN